MSTKSKKFRAPPGMTTTTTTPLLAQRFPVDAVLDFALSNGETVAGRVYCTDEASSTVVIQRALPHTTLSKELRILSARHIVTTSPMTNHNNNDDPWSGATLPEQPLQDIQRKVLEERERKSIKQAKESLRHINPKVCVGTSLLAVLLDIVATIISLSCCLLLFSFSVTLHLRPILFAGLARWTSRI